MLQHYVKPAFHCPWKGCHGRPCAPSATCQDSRTSRHEDELQHHEPDFASVLTALLQYLSLCLEQEALTWGSGRWPGLEACILVPTGALWSWQPAAATHCRAKTSALPEGSAAGQGSSVSSWKNSMANRCKKDQTAAQGNFRKALLQI